MNLPDDRLYDLLPAIYRLRDADGDLPLRALLSVVAREVAVVEEDLDQLYDDLFIETCAEWAVPYVGDLVGVGALHDLKGAASRRAQVANTVAYRRRKGTAAVLEGLARDATGWPAHAVEFFRWLATTQHVNHVRPSNHGSPDLRNWKSLEYVHTPFDDIAHTADVRRIASGRGRYNIPNVGIFLWRLQPYSLTLSPAVRKDARRYLFSPLGADAQLYTKPEPEPDIGHLSEPINVPDPIRRRVLHENLEAYYGTGKSISLVGVYERQAATGPRYKVVAYGPEEIKACNLSDTEDENGAVVWAHEPEGKISLDPVLGRIFFSAEPPQGYVLARLLATHHYGFAADVGGGEYDRAARVREAERNVERVMMPEVGAALAELEEESVEETPRANIREALEALDQADEPDGVVEVLDSGRYEERFVGTPSVRIRSERRVEVRAADGHRPAVVLDGDLKVDCGAASEVTLNGLLIAGGTVEVDGNPSRVRLLHCTLVPGIGLHPGGRPRHGDRPSLIVAARGATVEIDRCIVGGLRIAEGNRVRITNSVVDATDPDGVAYAAPGAAGRMGGRLSIENCTVVGAVRANVLDLASNTIFLGDVRAQRRQQGCVRFSYLPLDAEVPGRYRCRPQNESEAGRVRPQFVSLRYGKAGYCQLRRRCAEEIRRGADDESEMGAFHDLYAPQREANLRGRLDEYLRFGLEAGILYAT